MNINYTKNNMIHRSHTIDIKHSEIQDELYNINTTTIPSLIQEKKELTQKLSTISRSQIDEYMNICDKITEINQELRTLKRKSKTYLLDNSKFIFDYFEQKQQISSESNTHNQNTNSLNSFFKLDNNNSELGEDHNKHINNNTKTYQQYWQNVNNEITNIKDFVVNTDICPICNVGELITQDEDGILICNDKNCGKFITYILDSTKPTNKEPPNEVSYTAYIRLNHFKEILSQFQAKETTQIPDEVIQNIRNRIKKERITDMTTLNYDKMREILRKLGYNRFFEHIQYINSIFGIKPPIMSEELHETLCVLFIEIQKPWALHCPPNRTNFFNYTYTLHQLCVLIGQVQYLPYIQMMKDREKQLEQDLIWKKVCKDLDWEYAPTV
jgi:hypothetical protein